MPTVDGAADTGGDRDIEITLERDEGHDHVAVAELFDGKSQLFDPTSAVEFTTVECPTELQRLRPGDVLVMRVTINR
jgi:hypothetical protein